MPTEEQITAAARALRHARVCDPEMDFPCPFCLWGRDDSGLVAPSPGRPGDYETGCMYLAEVALVAAETVGKP